MRNRSIILPVRGSTARSTLARLGAALSTTTALIALTASPALADEAAADASDNSGEIIVTAQRREQSILQVPLSVASLSTEQMDQQGIRRINDIARLTPSLRFTQTSGVTGNNGANISIRGIASDVGAATTAIYVDDTPIQIRSVGYFPGNPYPRVFDLERVEVLRGPQGTLFGAGAEGGAVRFLTPQPSFDTMSVYGRAEVSTTEKGAPSYEIGIAAGGPVSDTLAVRFSAWHRKDGGWIDLIAPPTALTTPNVVIKKDYNDEETTAAKVAISWRPVPELTITPGVYYQRIDTGGRSQFWEQFSSNHDFVTGRTNDDGTQDKFVLPSLKVQYDASKAISVIGNVSYFDREQHQVLDYANYLSTLRSGSPFGTYANKLATNAFADLTNRQKNLTAEFRVQSYSDDSLIDWTVGAYYSRTKQHLDYYSASGRIPGVISSGFPQYLNRYNLFEQIDANDKQIAGFANVDIKPAEGLKITLGARYTNNKFYFLNFRTGPVNSGRDSTVVFNQDENSFTPKLGVSYQIDRNNMIYASASKGFRQGGAQPIVDPNFCAADLKTLGVTTSPQDYKSDSLWSYEAGTKNKLLGGMLTVDANVYLIKWKNIQQAIRLPNCGFTFIGNLGQATARGTDISIAVEPVKGLQIGGAIGYNKTTYDNPVYFDGNTADTNPGVLVKLKDQRIGGPSWTGSAYVQGDFPVSDTVNAYARADYSFTNRGIEAAPNGVFGYDPGLPALDGTDYLIMRVGAKFSGLDLSLFVDNVTNQDKPLSRNHDLVGSPLYYSATYRPRTFGMTLQYRY